MFTSSYFPLFIIMCVIEYPKYVIQLMVLIGIGFVSTVVLLKFLYNAQQSTDSEIVKVKSVASFDNEILSYTFMYLFPFIGYKLVDLNYMIALGIVFMIVFVMQISSNQFHLNPMFCIFQFHYYQIVTDSDKVILLMSKKTHIAAQQEIRVARLSNFEFVEVKRV